MNPLAALGVRIKLPPEAIIPLLIAVGVLLVLIFAGSGLQAWKDKHPSTARGAGVGLAVALTGASIYFLAPVLTETLQYDPIHTGLVQVGFTEGPFAGGFAALAAVLWRFANQRWIALGTGAVIGAALIVKPLVWPLVFNYRFDGDLDLDQWGLLDPEHLAFLGPGIVAVIVGLVAGLRRPS